MKKWIFLLMVSFAFLALYFKTPLPIGQPSLSYNTIPDTDGDLLVSLSIAEGGKLYTDFSILYPPGRFFLQAAALRLTNFSFPITSVMHLAAGYTIFPVAVFIVTFWLLQALIKQHTPIKENSHIKNTISFGLALLAPIIYLGMIRSAQEVHILLAGFFITLLAPGKVRSWRTRLLGFLFGLVVLFRTDTGIILFLALLVTYFAQQKFVQSLLLQIKKDFLIGVGIVWIPTLLLITFHGSLINFFYDTMVLGLIVQPKFMSLPLPLNDVRLIFFATLIFLLATAGALFIETLRTKKEKKPKITIQNLGLQIFAGVSVLSFVSALGRSDEPHLWYGLVWISPMLVYAIYRVGLYCSLQLRNRQFDYPNIISAIQQSAVIAVATYAFGYVMLELKSPIIFLISAAVCIYTLVFFKIRPLSLIIGGTLSALIVFHSLSYLNLRWQFPRQTLSRSYSHHWLTAQEDEFYGLKIVPETQEKISEIKTQIPQNEKYLFVFPKNVLLTRQLGFQSPTRHIIMMNERTNYTEQEILEQLKETKTQYFLIFTKDAQQRGGAVWSWIQESTEPVQSYMFGEDIAELRRLR